MYTIDFKGTNSFCQFSIDDAAFCTANYLRKANFVEGSNLTMISARSQGKQLSILSSQSLLITQTRSFII